MHHLRSVKPPHVQPPFNGCFLSSSARRRPIFLILNWKCKTISKSIQTTDQNCPLCNFLKDPADKLYLIAILRDFFQLRKLKRILLSSAEKCSKSIFFQRCTGIEDVSAVQSIFNFYQIFYQIGLYRLKVCNQYVDSFLLVYKRRSGNTSLMKVECGLSSAKGWVSNSTIG